MFHDGEGDLWMKGITSATWDATKKEEMKGVWGRGGVKSLGTSRGEISYYFISKFADHFLQVKLFFSNFNLYCEEFDFLYQTFAYYRFLNYQKDISTAQFLKWWSQLIMSPSASIDLVV